VISRREFLGGAAAGVAALYVSACSGNGKSAVARTRGTFPNTGAFQALDAKIEAAMRANAIPGVAVGMIMDGKEYVKGYGVTNVDYPLPVDANTVFRINSTTKTFTGTAVMRLVDEGKVDLDTPVRKYLPDFATTDAAASAQVTVRQLLNHSAGWLGDDLQGFGEGDDALARFVASMKDLPQLTSPGSTFSYNNAALCVAGRIVEVVQGSSYEAAVKTLLLDPLGFTHSRFFANDIVGFNVAASHKIMNGKAVVDPALWPIPRSNGPTGNLLSSVGDQMRWARFHLGDGRAPDGSRLLSEASLKAMQSRPGPGGTLIVELDGMGVAWMLRPSAEGVQIVQHGGSGAGQPSGFVMVPSKGFALTVLTNSDGGAQLISELFYDDWALRRFAGVSNLPASPMTLSADQLSPYEGRYVGEDISEAGNKGTTVVEFRAQGGRLDGRITAEGQTSSIGIAFYRPDFGLDFDAAGKSANTRSDFLRDGDGTVQWWRRRGRLYRRQS